MTDRDQDTTRPVALFIDPIRQPPFAAITCRTVGEAIACLKSAQIGRIDVHALAGIHDPNGGPSIFELAFALRELIVSGAIAPPRCEVHGGTAEQNAVSRKLLSAALNPASAPPTPTRELPLVARARRFEDLDETEVALLGRLNSKLREVERWILERSRAVIAHWSSLPHGTDADLEIESTIRYVLREDDPRFREDDDNFILECDVVTSPTGLRKRRRDGRIECYFATPELDRLDDTDWSLGTPEIQQRRGMFRHCWLFHDLYGHQKLSTDDLLAIGCVWVNLDCKHQRFVAV